MSQDKKCVLYQTQFCNPEACKIAKVCRIGQMISVMNTLLMYHTMFEYGKNHDEF